MEREKLIYNIGKILNLVFTLTIIVFIIIIWRAQAIQDDRLREQVKIMSEQDSTFKEKILDYIYYDIIDDSKKTIKIDSLLRDEYRKVK